MNWSEVNAFAADWAVKQRLPDKLAGRWLELVDFDTDEDCQYFYPGRDLLSHRTFLNAVARLAQRRGARTRHVRFSPDHYPLWRESERREDKEEERSDYIESRYRVMS